MKKVLIPKDIPSSGKDFLAEKGYEVVVGGGLERRALLHNLATADALIVRTEEIDAEAIEAAPRLKIISRFGVGLDNVDVDAATRRGIYVAIAKGANAQSVAEHALMLLLAAGRRLIYLHGRIQHGGWELRDSSRIFQMHGKTLGIIGLGDIGMRLARMAHYGLGMEILAWNRRCQGPNWVEMLPSVGEVLRRADAVSLHLPAAPGTTGLINRETLQLMKPDAILVNTARGALVDEDDLYDALSTGKLFAAASDVFSQEPPSPGNKLLQLDNFIASPHNAALTVEAAEAMSLAAARAVHQALSGETPEHTVNMPLT